MLRIALATDRSASTWNAHFATLHAHHFSRIGMASDRGVGLVAGSREAHPEALGVREQLPALHALCNLRPPWERKASSAIAKDDAAIRQLPHAKSASNLKKRLLQDEQAHQACAPAMARDDHLDRLLQWLQEALQRCTPPGKPRTKAGVRAALTLLLPRLEARDAGAMGPLLTPIRAHLDDSVGPYEHAAMLDAQLLERMPQHV